MFVVKERSERYETVDTLADGAMGTVLLARDRILDRLVAIKTINLQSVTDPSERQRLSDALAREAQVVQLLSHPNIVTVHDLVSADDNHPPSLVMEYVQGSSLESFLKGGSPLPLDFVISVVAQLADALDHAHTMGVIHGDIKPGNILISDDGERAKIVDFGIARLMGDERSDGRLFGTPRYVSPELLLGQSPDPRSDLFSLGVVFFEMLTGRSPFLGTTSEEIAQEIVGGSADLTNSALTEVPEPLRPVLGKALQKEPGDRFQSAQEFAEAIQDPDTKSSPPDVVATQDLSALVVPEIPDIESKRGADDSGNRVSEVEGPVDSRPRSSRVREPLPWVRLSLIGGVTAALTILVGLLTLWLASPNGPIDGSPTADHQLRTTVFPLLQESRRQLLAGEPEVAARILKHAQSLALGNSHVAELIASTESETRQLQADLEHSEELNSLITQSREALDAGSSQRAIRLATQALSMDPESFEARALIDAAQARKSRPSPRSPQPEEEPSTELLPAPTTSMARDSKTQPAPSQTTPSPTPTISPKRTRPTPTSSTSDLRVDVFSYLSKGVLTVYAGHEQVLLEPFRFVQKSGFMRKKKTAGRLEESVELPAGETEFRIYVSAEGQETQSVKLDAKLHGGRTHVLRLIIAENGSASAQLN